VKTTARLGLLGLMLAVSACSILETDKIDYKSAGRAPTLDIPPDLTQLTGNSRYVQSASGSATASDLQASMPAIGAAPSTSNAAAAQLGDVRVERDGNTRWLVVDRPADRLWDPVRDFWTESGFLLTIDQANLGIMETDWAENRAKIPQDFIRSTLGKLIDSVYSSGERDKFRTRLERRADGKTEIYVSHRGMAEVYTDRGLKDQTVWQPRPADPELEAEFLRRMMVKLSGVSKEKAEQLVAAPAVQASTSRIVSLDGRPAVQMEEGFDRAWRRVGLTLDRTGFTVEDRDRSQGVYFVRYVAPNADRQPQGFFGKLLNRTPDAPPPVKYRILVRGQAGGSTVSVLDTSGQPTASADASRIVKVIADDLR
jgi:outer membrane protein assembly factor BamC